MDDCTPSDPCKETGCPFCFDYVEAYESGSRLLDTLTVRQRRVGRVAQSAYGRSAVASIPPPSWLVRGIATRASLTLLAGKFGTYKSFVSIALAASVATGRPFLGHPVDEAGPVIYIAAEGLSGIQGRLDAWEQTHNGGHMIDDELFTVIGTAVDLRSGDDMAALTEICSRLEPRLIVWDTLHRCAPGVDENSNTEMGVVIDRLSWLRESHHATQLVVHHTGHGGQRSRGASSIEDDFDNSWVITLAGDGEERGPDRQRTMEHRKVKDGELSGKIPIGLTAAAGSAFVEQKSVGGAGDARQMWLVATSYAHKVDALGLPLDAGRARIGTALGQIGIVCRDNNMLSKVAEIRKQTGYLPGVSAEAS